MALLDFLKRKKEVAASREPRQRREKAAEKKPAKVLNEKPAIAEAQKPQKRRNIKGFSYSIVKEPHISEKATNLSEKNQYIFKVDKNANKTEVKKSVEGIYGVDVLSVNMIKIPKKKRRIGRTEGFRKGHTKAVVKIAEGQKIEIL